ncbi:hypothetical protein VHUM_01494 [Vanrija humicola]|uniref:SAM-dependent MTase RsmB/NOP-type domain-containing protein n=1 Tax=Vanrija humicola TaxID=5417 RepID=A0A7D8Z5V3_VANHU|nr:hypothetical protein VHUM_01494 [Vanrija humicola]
MNFYRSAALALDHLDKHQGSVKGSLAAAKVNRSAGESKRILAPTDPTPDRDVLKQLLTTVPLTKLERETFRAKGTPSSANLLLVLLHDLLFTPKGKIEASEKWPPKEAVLRHSARLKAELVRLQIKAGKSSVRELGKAASSTVEARYVRWNPNVELRRADDFSLSALHRHLAAKGFTLLDAPVYPVPDKSYFMDPHLSEHLLVFPAASTWWVGDKWYESGAVILQDKASCFPAYVVMDGWEPTEGECIDATAAPGNKTSYMSALMGAEGALYAFERSPNRYRTLCNMLQKAECANVQATRGDFTETDPADYPNVTRILLDPSCSGSGIVNRLDYLVDADEAEDDEQAERLEKLAAFQLQMIQHAFKFPAAQRVVYSTCSIHAEEDERVVAKALASAKGKWKLAPRASVLPKWERRGLVDELGNGADSVIRCLPEDKTNGFFVSCFVRVEEGQVAGTKRAREEAEEEAEDNEGEEEDEPEDASAAAAAPPKAKTAAQLDRARRKKQLQKKRRKAAK